MTPGHPIPLEILSFDDFNIDSDPNDILEANVHGFGGPRLNADQW